MSLRNLRKIYGGNTLPPPEDNEENFEPTYSKHSPSKFGFQGLSQPSSHSESEHDSADAEVELAVLPKKKHKKKQKKNKVDKSEEHVEEPLQQSSHSESDQGLALVVEVQYAELPAKKKNKKKQKKNKMDKSKEPIEEMDEIDKCLMEVNALLGSPPEPSVSAQPPAPDPAKQILAVQAKFLDASYEIKKLFGAEALEARRRGRNLNPLMRRAVIVSNGEKVNFLKYGLSMSIQRREGDITYFTFDHNKRYQKMQQAFLLIYKHKRSNNLPEYEPVEDMHVEGLLEKADVMFQVEEFTIADHLVEHCVGYMQCVAHSSFNLTNGKSRLEYKYPENRPFHIAVLKYLHMLTNRACHRTALELAKLLLSLDASDPLAMVFIIDALALRAREHEWLITAVDYWTKERDAGFLFNIAYSYAMAKFHVATKNREDLAPADALLQTAMMRFPLVVAKILECANMPNPRITDHALFKTVPDKSTTTDMKEVMFFYCKFTWPKWREPAVFEWFLRNANALIDKYDADAATRETVKKYSKECLSLFLGIPTEVARHMSVIKPMASLLVEGAVPRVSPSLASDPLPPANTIDRYGYNAVSAADSESSQSLYDILISTIMPNILVNLMGNEDNAPNGDAANADAANADAANADAANADAANANAANDNVAIANAVNDIAANDIAANDNAIAALEEELAIAAATQNLREHLQGDLDGLDTAADEFDMYIEEGDPAWVDQSPFNRLIHSILRNSQPDPNAPAAGDASASPPQHDVVPNNTPQKDTDASDSLQHNDTTVKPLQFTDTSVSLPKNDTPASLPQNNDTPESASQNEHHRHNQSNANGPN